MTDILAALNTSTAQLHARFDLDGIAVPPKNRRRIFMEEVEELIEASVTAEILWDGAETEEVCNEAADVIVTAIGILYAHGADYADLVDAIERVIRKNDFKTVENGYAKVNGKIRKVEAQP